MNKKGKMVATALLSGAFVCLLDDSSLVDDEKLKVKAAMMEQEVNPLTQSATPLESIFSNIDVYGVDQVSDVSIVRERSEWISGKGIRGAAVRVRVGNTEIGNGRVTAFGTFDFKIVAQKAGTKLSIVQVVDGEESIPLEITVRGEATPAVSMLDRPYLNSKILTGQGIPGAIVSARINGTEIGQARVYPDGNFEIPLNQSLANLFPGTRVAVFQIRNDEESLANESIPYASSAPDVSILTVTSSITTNTTKITGRAEPGALVNVRVAPIGTRIGGGRADLNGNFEIYIPKQAVFRQLDFNQVSKGIASIYSGITVSQGIGKVGSIGIVKANDTKVIGKGTPGATVRVKVGDTEIGKNEVDSQGNFSVGINKQVEGTKLSITQASGTDESDAVVVTVEKSTQLPAVTLTTHYAGATYLRGVAPAGATKVTLKIDGKNVRTVDVAADNSFRIYANDVAGLKQVGTIFEVVAQDADGQLSEVAASTVEEVPVAELDAFNVGHTHVTGKVAKGMTRVSLYDKAGTLLRHGEINADGAFRILASDLPALRVVGDTFTVKVTSATGVVSNASVGTVGQDQTIAAAPTIANYLLGDTYITGKVSAGATKVFLRIDGKAVRGGTIAADGSYRIYANDLPALKLVGAIFEVVTQDANNKYSEVAKGEVLGMPAPTVLPYRAGQAYVNGTVSEEAARISVHDKAGTLLRNGQINTDGTFRIYVSGVAALQIAGDRFIVRAFNANGTKTSETSVVILPK
ncbi:Ig-like domain-containing protein [Listeria grandensis]|uniref:Ig-like domain-containing protein n=1 Tax=Listeria grandensis TaxID=1494963 RepID=UPI00164DC154|nr:Ig-like domain-containing protein [Listeria grandensis]MBC6314434.1 hypothetical protein [Listeria grandensis]